MIFTLQKHLFYLVMMARSVDSIFGVLAALMAHGYNIGPHTISKLIDGITYKEICRSLTGNLPTMRCVCAFMDCKCHIKIRSDETLGAR